MDFDEYQQEASKTAVYPKEKALEYTSTALAGEVGELMNYIGKYYRGDFEKLDREKLIIEGGGVLWELSEFFRINGINLNKVAEKNLAKLKDRQARGVLKGSGDKR
jgi:NTP pyrophosphatase (non-canonical NTP hydrolase)